MNINRALKEKARMVRKLDELYTILIGNNSIEESSPRRYSMHSTLQDITSLRYQLVDLKTKIHRANSPVYDKIFMMSELKNSIKKLKEMSVLEGKKVGHFSTTSENLKVEIDAVERDRLVNLLQIEVDGLQDELDTHNATTEI